MIFDLHFLKNLIPIMLAAIGGAAWLIGGTSLIGPLLSILLPIAASRCNTKKQAYTAALIYYLIGSISIIGAITGYYGVGYWFLGSLAWIGASAVLALPWTLARSSIGLLFALIATAIPPLGVIGWLSPLNSAGVLFPSTGLLGILFVVILLIDINFLRGMLLKLSKIPIPRQKFAKNIIWSNTLIVIVIGIFGIINVLFIETIQPPKDWIGLQTRIPPARKNLIQSIANNQTLIDAALEQGKDARVVVFPEAVLDDWYPGTQQQFSLAAPSGQTWLIGASVATPRDKPYNAVVSVSQNKADPVPLTTASGLLLGGDWIPWSKSLGFKPGIQRTFEVQHQNVWAALCIEQLQPWTWLLAIAQKPTLILAMSNAWWAPSNSFAPKIQIASTKAWARLMKVPVIWATNSPAAPVEPPLPTHSAAAASVKGAVLRQPASRAPCILFHEAFWKPFWEAVDSL